MVMSYFYLLVIANSVAINIHVQVFKYLLSVLLGKYLEEKLLDHMIIHCLTF